MTQNINSIEVFILLTFGCLYYQSVDISTNTLPSCRWCKHKGEVHMVFNILNILGLIYIVGFDIWMTGVGLAYQPH